MRLILYTLAAILLIAVLGITIIAIKHKVYVTHVPYSFIEEYQSKSSFKFLIYQTGTYKVLPEFVKYSKLINQHYCQRWGYDYHFSNEEPYASPYWIKVLELYKLMENNRTHNYIMYLDMDAIVKDHNMRMEDFIMAINQYTNNDDWSFYISNDYYFAGLLNAGCYIVRNNLKSRQIIKDWIQEYENSRWYFKDDKWKCNLCLWAGPQYEQGALEKLFFRYQKHIILLPRMILANKYPERKSFVLHLMGHKNEDRNRIFKDFYQLLKKNDI